MVKAGTTAAPVCSATRATPLAVQAGMPKNGTNTPCGGVMLVSISTPTVSLLRMACSKPRAKSCLLTTDVAVQSAVTGDQIVDVRIVQRTHDNANWVPLQGVKERADFPSAEMCREQQHSLGRDARRLRNFQTPDRPRPAKNSVRV